MAIKKETDAKSKIKVAVKEIAEKAADKVKKVTKVAEKKTASKSATLKTMKEAEEKAMKAVSKVKKAAVAKASATADKAASAKKRVVEGVKAVAAKKTVAKTATKAPATKTATTKVAKTTAPAAKASAATKASEKEVAKMAQSFDAEYLVLMQKDPNWMHAFWEVSENRINEAKKGKGKIVLRLFDIADDLTVQRSKKRKFRDIEVPANARSWYVENTAGKSCVAVLGAVSGKNFKPIVESTPVMTKPLLAEIHSAIL